MPSWLRALLIAVCVALLLVVGPHPTDARQGPPADPWSYAHVAGDLLVQFRPGSAGASAAVAPSASANFDRYLSAYGVDSAEGGLGPGAFRLHFRNDTDLPAMQQDLRSDPSVAYAEPNYILTMDRTPNDPQYAQQWALPKIGADKAWDLTTGGPIVIAMLDTGISPTHPDLAGRLVPGYDFINNTAQVTDDNGHGTFTAGIAGASGNNGVGVAGMSWGARLMPVKILDQDGRGPVSAFAQGIRFAVDNGAQIVNVSAGIPVPSQTMEAAVSYAISQNVVVVAASGNVADGVQNYPAAYPNVIAVAASTPNDTIADFSSYGSYVWVSAPGVNILSTYYKDGDTYAILSGTSASTPFVSGTIALMMSLQPKAMTPQAVRQILRATAVDILTPGFDPQSGFGRLDTFHAVVLASMPQPTLTGAAVTPTSGKGNEAFVFSAAGFAPNEPVTVWLTLSDGSYRYYRYPSVFADAKGNLQVALGTGDPIPAGTQRVTAYGEQSHQVAATTFAVTQAVNTQAFQRVDPVPETPTRVYFAATGHTLQNGFLAYWKANGGLAVFGFPISEEFTEISPTDGKPYTVQYFERNRFEYHPEFKGTPYEVELGLLGRDLTAGRNFQPAGPPVESTDTRVYFPETQHSLSGDFLIYWENNGGLAIFGYPISEPFMEVNTTDGKVYLVQYFERNRFELHPENQAPYNVLLGLLGTQAAKLKGYLGP
ncbi:MAG TPA: S8 family peptidase [Thermomicrobiales bacterium]|nr:S8 family peptidase [Thermomicrobiales bacterium]